MTTQQHQFQQAAGLFVQSLQRNSVFNRLQANEPQHAKDERQRLANLRDARRTAALDAIRHKLTPEFLKTLAQLARIHGERNDWGTPVVDVIDVFGEAGNANPPIIEPIDFDQDQP